MAVSKLEIFNTCLVPEKNAKIDNIEAFLSNTDYSVVKYSNDNFQYQKITLDAEIKITAAQADFNGLSVGNYIRLTQDGRKYYYFILSSEWTSRNSCRLFCSLDTINTFGDSLEWSDKTLIQREHDDRFKRYKSQTVVSYDIQKYFDTGEQAVSFEHQLIIPELINVNILSVSGTYIDSSTPPIAQLDDVYDVYYTPDRGDISFTQDFSRVGSSTSLMGFSGRVTLTVEYEATKRQIDKIPEGLNPQLLGQDLGTIYDQRDTDSWYVIYNSTTGEKAPIDTYLCKDRAFTALISSGETNKAVIVPSMLEEGYYYFIDPFNGTGKQLQNPGPQPHWFTGDLNPQTITGANNELVLKTSYKEMNLGYGGVTGGNITCFVFQKTGEFLNGYKVEFVFDDATQPAYTRVTSIITTTKLNIESTAVFKCFKSKDKPVNAQNIIQYSKYVNSPIFVIEAGEKVPTYISGFETLNRTKSTLFKIIKLPYCPIKFTINEQNQYDFELNVQNSQTLETLGGTFLKISNEIEFGTTLDTNMDSPFKPAVENLWIRPGALDSKDIKYESKLYNSEFYQPKFYYDSFGFLFDCEKISNQSGSDKLQLSFTPSRIFNSAMMFKFPEYVTNGRDEQDFNNILIANRNNEIPIYSSEYLNYVRFGENYDVKVKNTQLGFGVANVALQTAGTIAAPFITSKIATNGLSKLQDAASKNINETLWANPQARKAAQATQEGFLNELRSGGQFGKSLTSSMVTAGAFSGGLSVISNVLNLAEQQVLAGEAIKHKKELLSNQAVSVSTCDSVDLLQKYADNKAKMKLYKTSELTTEQVYDLFYYNGYNRNIRRKPNTTSRYWFNYIQCEPVFNSKTNVAYNDYLEDIKERYRAGVTVYHYHPDFSYCYDIDQEKENWETTLLV